MEVLNKRITYLLTYLLTRFSGNAHYNVLVLINKVALRRPG